MNYSEVGCTGCHKVRGEGGYLGPDLTYAGLTPNRARIRKGQLAPNGRLAKGFDPVTVTLAGGTRVEGVAKNYSNYALRILDPEGRLHFLANDGAAQNEFLDGSWMPADCWDRLGDDETQDILAFLVHLSLSFDKIPSASGPQ